MAQNYDKVIKEVLRNSIIGFMNLIAGKTFEAVQDIEPKIQKTIEREPDFFKIVRYKNQKKLRVLHIEWQLKTSWKTMRNRMMFYKVLGISVTDLPVVQYLILLGKRKPRKAIKTYKDDGMDYFYRLIPIKSISYKKLLNAPEIEVALFAVLADFEKEEPKVIIEKIGQRIMKEADGELHIQKLQQQLEIISKIHNLQELTIKILESMPITYDIKTDVRFLQGQEVGVEKGIEKGIEQGLEKGKIEATLITVINMLIKTDFTNQQIVDIAPTDVNFVIKWKKILEKHQLKKLWNSFGTIEKNKTKAKERSEKIADTLLKIKELSPEVISKITDLSLREVKIQLTKIKK